MSSNIHIKNEVVQFINQHGESYFPNECCGFLYGHDGAQRTILEAQPVANSKDGDQRRRFEISPLDYLQAERYALENDLQLLGIYHSHPNHPAIASEHDLAKALPFFSYVIVSVNDGVAGDLKSWKLYDEQRAFFEERVAPLAGGTPAVF
ncbi:MAG: M67 family metallopeptidase [Bacteroidota bacterium]